MRYCGSKKDDFLNSSSVLLQLPRLHPSALSNTTQHHWLIPLCRRLHWTGKHALVHSGMLVEKQPHKSDRAASTPLWTQDTPEFYPSLHLTLAPGRHSLPDRQDRWWGRLVALHKRNSAGGENSWASCQAQESPYQRHREHNGLDCSQREGGGKAAENSCRVRRLRA